MQSIWLRLSESGLICVKAIKFMQVVGLPLTPVSRREGRPDLEVRQRTSADREIYHWSIF